MSWALTSERLRFRRLREGDLPSLAAMFADPEVMEFARDGRRDVAATLAWFEGHCERFPRPPWGFCAALRADGTYVGHVGLLPQTVNGTIYCEVGYWLARPHWGNGYATEGARRFRDFAFDDLAEREVISLIHPQNLPSQAVAQRNGMTLREEVAWNEIPRVLRFGISRDEWTSLRDPA